MFTPHTEEFLFYMKNIIINKSKELLEKAWSYRCHIHSHPELSYQEFQTQEYILNILQKIGYTDLCKCATTGVVAILNADTPGKCIALRADMDALPIHEKNNTSYTSQNEGVMHACGHDFHTANLLAVAEILFDIKDQLKGKVKFIFQPGEEKNPGGASLMIADGVLSNPSIDVALALHVFPSMPVGKVGFHKGLYMASCDELYITIRGKGGHAAVPQYNIDPIPVMCRWILEMDKIRQEATEKSEPTILAFGKIEALGATNVIPDEVKIAGTFRAMNEDWRKYVHTELQKISESLAEQTQTQIQIHIDHGYPCLYNDENLTDRVIQTSGEILGAENVVMIEKRMASEDFAFFSQHIPVCFYRIGTDNLAGDFSSNVHTPVFDVDKDALLTSMQTLSYATFQYLNSDQSL